jgi:hypothetical protein
MEIAQSKKKQAQKALREHFEVNVNLKQLGPTQTHDMLSKVRGLLKETRAKNGHKQMSPSYLKLVMMEQMLSHHYSDIRKQPRIVVENEEVEKSQVILAAQDLCDQLQKMVEQISKMTAEELPAVVTGISNEIGTQESESYNQSVSEALTTLQQAVTAAKGTLSSSLGTITGQGGGEEPAFGGGDDDMGGDDLMGGGDDMGGDDIMGGGDDELPELPEPDDEPEEDFGTAGRGLR